MKTHLTIALAGNPNCGKTALFNALTGSRQREGNWPGVTVARKSGYFTHEQQRVEVVDLPGTYALTVLNDGAVDEKIACDFLHSHKADLVVNVIDGTNLVRNLYLTLQLLEMHVPVILVVNMMDLVEKQGLDINVKRLAKALGVPVVPIVASQRKGLEALKNKILSGTDQLTSEQFSVIDNAELKESLSFLSQHILKDNLAEEKCEAQWLALRVLEGDAYAKHLVNENIKALALAQSKLIEKSQQEEPDILIADARYRRATSLADQVVSLHKTKRQTVTELIDKVVLNRFLGIPIFLLVMYLMFVFAINFGGAFQDFFDISSTVVFVDGLAHGLNSLHAPAWLIAVLAGGVGKGINTVVTFAPVIGAMFLFLALLEDCGYMARAAFVMDRFMQMLGLPGKSFVPMIVGFGCNVPAVMGARTLSQARDRILTVMMMPFMSCGARLAIFSVFASAFFPRGGALIIFGLYLTGILVAVFSGLILRKTLLPGEPAPLVMELPSYHAPRLGSLVRVAWQRLSGFLFRAGKYIIPICVLIGALNSISVTGGLVSAGSQQSLLARLGRVVTPIFSPMGIQQDNWPATVGLATGVLAKEVVVGTLNSLYAGGEQSGSVDLTAGLKAAVMSVPHNLAGLGAALSNPIAASAPPHEMSQSAYGKMYRSFDGKVGAFAYLLFVLLYFPCVSTMAAMRREVNRKWAYFSMGWSTGLAYALSVIIYQAMTLALHPLNSLVWIITMCFGLTLAFTLLSRLSQQGPETPPGDSGFGKVAQTKC